MVDKIFNPLVERQKTPFSLGLQEMWFPYTFNQFSVTYKIPIALTVGSVV